MTSKSWPAAAEEAEHPTLRFRPGAAVVPGDRIGTIREAMPSIGTVVQRGQIYASLLGHVSLKFDQEKGKWLVSVETKEKASDRVISEGQVVLCRVTRISTQQAFVQILAIEGAKHEGTLEEWQRPEGSIRKEDIRSNASEQVLIQESFLPADLVLARVLSLGDLRRYILGTGEPQLGVLRAVSATSGRPMIPASWKEMECPVTGIKEPRKCAKPRKLIMSEA